MDVNYIWMHDARYHSIVNGYCIAGQVLTSIHTQNAVCLLGVGLIVECHMIRVQVM